MYIYNHLGDMFVSENLDKLANKVIEIDYFKTEAYYTLFYEYFENIVYENIKEIRISYEILKRLDTKPCIRLIASNIPYLKNEQLLYDSNNYIIKDLYIEEYNVIII